MAGEGMHGGKGGMCGRKGGIHGGGACMEGGCAWAGWGECMCGRGGACVARGTATAAEGTHPTGMHSCLSLLPLQLSFFQCHLDVSRVSCDDKTWKEQFERLCHNSLVPNQSVCGQLKSTHVFKTQISCEHSAESVAEHELS